MNVTTTIEELLDMKYALVSRESEIFNILK